MKYKKPHFLAYKFGIIRNLIWLAIGGGLIYIYMEKGTLAVFSVGLLIGAILYFLYPTPTGQWLFYQINNTTYINYLFHKENFYSPEEILKYIEEDKVYFLLGKTYRFKENLKKLGGKWNPDRRMWEISGKALKHFLSVKSKEIKNVKFKKEERLVIIL